MTGYARLIALTAFLAAALAVSSCAGGGNVRGDGVPLSAEEIKTALVGNSIVGDNWDGPYVVYFPVYGEARGLRANHYTDLGQLVGLGGALLGTLYRRRYHHLAECGIRHSGAVQYSGRESLRTLVHSCGRSAQVPATVIASTSTEPVRMLPRRS